MRRCPDKLNGTHPEGSDGRKGRNPTQLGGPEQQRRSGALQGTPSLVGLIPARPAAAAAAAGWVGGRVCT